MNEVGFCPVVSGVLSCGVLSVWGFVSVGFCPVGFCPYTSWTTCMLNSYFMAPSEKYQGNSSIVIKSRHIFSSSSLHQDNILLALGDIG